MPELTPEHYIERRKALYRNLGLAKGEYRAAALAAATAHGGDDAQREAKAEVDQITDQLSALETAWGEQLRQNRRRAVEQERERFAADLARCREIIEARAAKGVAFAEALVVAAEAWQAVKDCSSEMNELQELMHDYWHGTVDGGRQWFNVRQELAVIASGMEGFVLGAAQDPRTGQMRWVDPTALAAGVEEHAEYLGELLARFAPRFDEEKEAA